MGEDRIGWGTLQSEEIPVLWPKLEGFINDAVQRGDGTISAQGILHSLAEKHMQMWLVVDNVEEDIVGVVVTQVTVHMDGHKELCIVAAGGRDVDAWFKYLDILDTFAHASGATVIRVTGRRGWLRKLKPFGFEERAVVLTKQVARRH
jgi:hypothetical protein